MGTNYYHTQIKNQCSHCGRGETTERHIGKSSGGWCFALHVYPGEGPENFDDWKTLIEQAGSIIKNEYGDTVTAQDMLKEIAERSCRPRSDRNLFGYSSWAEFDRKNESQEGPNGLSRHALSERCISHGSGTWDCLVGEFS